MNLKNGEASVEAYIVCERNRAHGMTGAKLHGNVNIRKRRVASVGHSDGRSKVGDKETINDESRSILARNWGLLDLLHVIHCGNHDIIIGFVSLDDLYKFHHLNGVKEMQPNLLWRDVDETIEEVEQKKLAMFAGRPEASPI